jgi:hypothetical protein
MKLGAQGEDGHAPARLGVFEISEHFFADEGLVLELGIQGIEQEDSYGVAEFYAWNVGVEVGGQGWKAELIFGLRRRGMLLEGDDFLRMTVFGYGEVFRVQAFGGFAIFVGYDDIDENGAGFGFEDGVAVGLRVLAEERGGLGGGEDGEQRWE